MGKDRGTEDGAGLTTCVGRDLADYAGMETGNRCLGLV